MNEASFSCCPTASQLVNVRRSHLVRASHCTRQTATGVTCLTQYLHLATDAKNISAVVNLERRFWCWRRKQDPGVYGFSPLMRLIHFCAISASTSHISTPNPTVSLLKIPTSLFSSLCRIYQLIQCHLHTPVLCGSLLLCVCVLALSVLILCW